MHGAFSSKPVVLNLFITGDRSTLDNSTAGREYSVMVVSFQQLEWSYQFEPPDKAVHISPPVYIL